MYFDYLRPTLRVQRIMGKKEKKRARFIVYSPSYTPLWYSDHREKVLPGWLGSVLRCTLPGLPPPYRFRNLGFLRKALPRPRPRSRRFAGSSGGSAVSWPRVTEADTGLSPLQLPPSPFNRGVIFPFSALNLSNTSVSVKLLRGSYIRVAYLIYLTSTRVLSLVVLACKILSTYYSFSSPSS